MAQLGTSLSPRSAAFQANREHMEGLLARVTAIQGRARAASGAAAARFSQRGQLLPRERVALLLDPGAPFLELCAMAGYRLDRDDPDKSIPGGGIIARIHGWPIGILSNNGPIDSAGASKATHFIQACCQAGTPLLYLNNTTGYMVGKRYEESGIIKHGSKMIQAVTKLIAHGADREAARAKLMHGVEETLALGLRTNQDFLLDCLANPVFAAGAATTTFIADNAAALFPDLARQEQAAAMRVAAILSAAPDVGVTHGFPRPVRLKRGETIYTLRVYAGPRGATRVEAAGEEAELVVARADGAFQLTQDGRSRKAVLARNGAQVWVRDEGRNWDFEDISFEPAIKIETDSDGKVRAAMNGRVASLDVAIGDRVTRGQTLLVLEAMKMEHVHVASIDGIVEAIHVAEGDQVEAHRVVVEVVAK
jgi:biotin carboxyl carrier protein